MGNAAVAELLISLLPDKEKKRFINSRTGGYDTALHIASANNNADMVTFLLLHGADPLARDICEQIAAEVTKSDEVRDVITLALKKQTQ